MTGIQYLDDKGRIRPELVGKNAEECAEDITRSNKLTTHQLRRFYNDLKALEHRFHHLRRNNDPKEAFYEIQPLVKLMVPKVKYAQNRGVVPEEFADWLGDCLNSIKEPKEFEAFMLHFEAVVGFCFGSGRLKDS
jgi:CRISPR-associated protein Csm2